MTTRFPAALDDFNNIARTLYAVEALEAKVGIDNSTNSASLDYKVRRMSSAVGPKIGVLGDSMTAVSYTSDASSSNFNLQGWVTWFRILSRQSVTLPQSQIYALGGLNTQTAISNGYLASAVAANLDVCLILLGVNDAASSTLTTAQTQANFDTIISSLLATGCLVVLHPILPNTTLTASQRRKAYTINEYLRDKAAGHPRILLADSTPAIINATDANGNPASGMLYDGLHPATQGSYLVARAFWRTISSLVPFRDVRFMNGADTYHATENTSGNLITNGLLNGTGGSKTGTSGVATGNVATDWTVTSGNPAGTIACACSKVTRTDGESGVWQQLVLSGTPTNAGAYTFQQNVTTNYAVGDIVELIVEFEVDASSTNITGIMAEIFDAPALVASRDGTYTAAQPIFAGEQIKGVLRTPRHTAATGSTTLQVNISVQYDAGAATAATVRLGRPSLRKV